MTDEVLRRHADAGKRVVRERLAGFRYTSLASLGQSLLTTAGMMVAIAVLINRVT